MAGQRMIDTPGMANRLPKSGFERLQAEGVARIHGDGLGCVAAGKPKLKLASGLLEVFI